MDRDMDVLRRNYAKLYDKLINQSPEVINRLTVWLCQDEVIGDAQKSYINRKFAVDQMLTDIQSHVNGRDDLHVKEARLAKVLNIMEKFHAIKDIVDDMREQYAPTPPIPDFINGDGSNIVVFLSFKWGEGEGEVLVDCLYDCLKKKGLNPWKDTEKMYGGSQLRHEIKEGVESCSLFVGLVSPSYFKSEYCKMEFIHALNNNKTIFPVQWTNIPGFQYPPVILAKNENIGDILRHRFNPSPVNMKAEIAKCAADIMRRINDEMGHNNEI